MCMCMCVYVYVCMCVYIGCQQILIQGFPKYYTQCTQRTDAWQKCLQAVFLFPQSFQKMLLSVTVWPLLGAMSSLRASNGLPPLATLVSLSTRERKCLLDQLRSGVPLSWIFLLLCCYAGNADCHQAEVSFTLDFLKEKKEARGDGKHGTIHGSAKRRANQPLMETVNIHNWIGRYCGEGSLYGWHLTMTKTPDDGSKVVLGISPEWLAWNVPYWRIEWSFLMKMGTSVTFITHFINTVRR